MIPKVIHYCWFGHNPLPPLAKKCIASWKRYLPDYEIKEWNEDNFDINIIPYVKEAYEAMKYAFVSDYARYWILYQYGGLYFDTDVEIIAPLDDIVSRGAFMGCQFAYGSTSSDYEQELFSRIPCLALGVNPGLGLGLGQEQSEAKAFFKEMLNSYATRHFKNADGSLNTKSIVYYTTVALSNHGLKYIKGIQHIMGIDIYPNDYFCPIDYRTNIMQKTSNSRTIHHFAASWLSWEKEMSFKFFSFTGLAKTRKLEAIVGRLIHIIARLLHKQ